VPVEEVLWRGHPFLGALLGNQECVPFLRDLKVMKKGSGDRASLIMEAQLGNLERAPLRGTLCNG
jgi:hypothetical protein